MSDDAPSFVRGIFAGAIHDSLLFPFPASLDERDPEETRTVRRLLSELERMSRGLIDPARFDEEETIPEEVIRALAETGWLGLSIPKEY
ncbi:MAG: acyl-CoA dehydrogenase, partial [Gemmatimonadetes bacterium]|nr:acyl-CoA dehydrogenase [Gemmatimonadota bacterium]